MVWAKLDDEILDNEKITNAGPLGFALHIAAITWCCRNLTDGFIPRSKVRGLLDFDGLSIKTGEGEFVIHAKDVTAADISAELVTVGLWDEDEERRGYWIHDFLDYNPTREKVLAERSRATERKQKSRMLTVRDPSKTKAGRGASQATSRRDKHGTHALVTPADRDGLVTDSHGPDPDPVPIQETPSRAREGVPTPRVWGRGSTAERALEVFADSVTAVTGEAFVVGPAAFLRDDLCALLNKGAPKGGTLDATLTWLGDTVQAWVRADPDCQDRKPSKLTDWLNAGKPDRKRKTGPRAVAVQSMDGACFKIPEGF